MESGLFHLSNSAGKELIEGQKPNNILMILLTFQDKVKLSDYGVYYMSNGGAYVSFPIG